MATAASGSAIVSVSMAAHGQSAGNTVVFPITTTGQGVTILGAYTVASVTDADSEAGLAWRAWMFGLDNPAASA